jgi:hypothetical protein
MLAGTGARMPAPMLLLLESRRSEVGPYGPQRCARSAPDSAIPCASVVQRCAMCSRTVWPTRVVGVRSRPRWTRSHKAPMNDWSETSTQSVRLPTNHIDRDPLERPFSLTPKHVRRKEIAMRTPVPPPPSQHCDICHGELRLKQIEPVGPLSLELDIEIFVCAKCGHEQSHRVSHDPYAAHAASNVSHAKMG